MLKKERKKPISVKAQSFEWKERVREACVRETKQRRAQIMSQIRGGVRPQPSSSLDAPHPLLSILNNQLLLEKKHRPKQLSSPGSSHSSSSSSSSPYTSSSSSSSSTSSTSSSSSSRSQQELATSSSNSRSSSSSNSRSNMEDDTNALEDENELYEDGFSYEEYMEIMREMEEELLTEGGDGNGPSVVVAVESEADAYEAELLALQDELLQLSFEATEELTLPCPVCNASNLRLENIMGVTVLSCTGRDNFRLFNPVGCQTLYDVRDRVGQTLSLHSSCCQSRDYAFYFMHRQEQPVVALCCRSCNACHVALR